MDTSKVASSPEKVKTVIPWDEHPEPWRTIGPGFAEECADIVSGVIPAHPPSRPPPMPNDLRKLRESWGMTQTDVARLVGTSHQQVSLAEHGMRRKWQRIIRAALEGLKP